MTILWQKWVCKLTKHNTKFKVINSFNNEVIFCARNCTKHWGHVSCSQGLQSSFIPQLQGIYYEPDAGDTTANRRQTQRSYLYAVYTVGRGKCPNDETHI